MPSIPGLEIFVEWHCSHPSYGRIEQRRRSLRAIDTEFWRPRIWSGVRAGGRAAPAAAPLRPTDAYALWRAGAQECGCRLSWRGVRGTHGAVCGRAGSVGMCVSPLQLRILGGSTDARRQGQSAGARTMQPSNRAALISRPPPEVKRRDCRRLALRNCCWRPARGGPGAAYATLSA